MNLIKQDSSVLLFFRENKRSNALVLSCNRPWVLKRKYLHGLLLFYFFKNKLLEKAEFSYHITVRLSNVLFRKNAPLDKEKLQMHDTSVTLWSILQLIWTNLTVPIDLKFSDRMRNIRYRGFEKREVVSFTLRTASDVVKFLDSFTSYLS